MARVVTRRQSAALLATAQRHADGPAHVYAAGPEHRHQVALAAAAVLSENPRDHMSVRQAARAFDLHKSTIEDAVQRVRAGQPAEPAPAGAHTALTAKEERFLVECVIKFSAQAMCLTKHDIQAIVDHLTVGPRVGHNKRKLKLTKDWRRGFLERHDKLIGYSHCIPLATQHVVTQELVEEVRNNFTEFNKLIDNNGIKDENIVAVDETGITGLKEDAAHSKVFHARNARPHRTVRIIQARATLLVALTAAGKSLSPVVVHPHVVLQPKQVQAFDKAAGGAAYHTHAPALHLPSAAPGSQSKKPASDTSTRREPGPTGSMSDFLFDKAMREHVVPQMSKEAPSVVAMDGASAHFNVRMLLHGRRDLRDEGPAVFYFTYPPNVSKFVAPPDDYALFGAFQRTRRQLLTNMGGPKSRVELMSSAGQAYRKNLRPAQIQSAFRRRGFVSAAQTRHTGQRDVLQQLQAHVDSREWAEEQVDSGTLPRSVLELASMQDRRKSGRPRKPLGKAIEPIGVLNSDEHIPELSRLLEERKRENENAKAPGKRQRKNE